LLAFQPMLVRAGRSVDGLFVLNWWAGWMCPRLLT
jgi:hypothetical protein